MEIRHVVAATDESDAGRQAVRTAGALAVRTGARLTIMRAVAAPDPVLAGLASVEAGSSSVERLERWVGADLPALAHSPAISFAVTYGLPGVEISRFAEREGADLLVLGRKPRSLKARLVVGDTTDAVARRSLVPCLFVPVARSLPRKLLAAIDGSERGMIVLTAAEDIARQIGANLHVVTVEPARSEESAHLTGIVPMVRSARLAAQVSFAEGRDLDLRRGDIVEQILAAVNERGPDVLVIGCHRGGPPGIIDAGSTARCLAHTAQCSVLTVPL